MATGDRRAPGANDELFDAVLNLPAEARAALAGLLIESLEESVDEQAEAQWADEIGQRLEDLDSGLVRGIPWSQARRTILGS